MILTNRPKRKEEPLKRPEKNIAPLTVLKPVRIQTRGKDKVVDEGCDCGLEITDEVEGTENSFLCYENPLNHEKLCLYRILCAM